jgi:hypothetical protein
LSGGPRIEDVVIPAEESVVIVWRAISKYKAVYDDLSPQMIMFCDRAKQWLQREKDQPCYFSRADGDPMTFAGLASAVSLASSLTPATRRRGTALPPACRNIFRQPGGADKPGTLPAKMT